MAKNQSNAAAAVETTVTEATVSQTNFTLTKHGVHPAHNPNRTSYTVAGQPGNLVIFNSLFAGGIAPDTLTLSVAVVSPKADSKAEKAELAAKRAEEKLVKAQARIQAQAAKAEERAAKAQAAIDKAKAVVAAAATTEAAAS